MKDRLRSGLGLVLFLFLCFGAAALGAISPPGEWYATLRKPSWNPPNWIFGPVWTTLYAMMAVAAWRIWRVAGFQRGRMALTIFFVQLFLNAIWSPLFFGMKRINLGLIDIVLLWFAIVATIISFAKISRISAWLLVPYLAWVSFAAFLNFTLWRLN